MPGVIVQYRKSAIDETAALLIRHTIEEFGVEFLQHPSLPSPLTPESFTIGFHEEGPWDKMTHDIIVRMPLHHFPERVERSDWLSEQLAKSICDALNQLQINEAVTIGVLLPMSEIGWGTATVEPNGHVADEWPGGR